MESQYNLKSPAVKRLMKEAKELSEPTEQYYAQPLEENLFEWHFTIRGPAESAFDNGVYHGRIILPPEYPMKPPAIMLLTPNGRFELHKKICLSISGHHPESWQPSWSIRTALLAIIGFMPTPGNGAIGSLDYTSEERQVLARRSQSYKCDICGHVHGKLLPLTSASQAAIEEAKALASQIHIEGEKPKEPTPLPGAITVGSLGNGEDVTADSTRNVANEHAAEGLQPSAEGLQPSAEGLRHRAGPPASNVASADRVAATSRVHAPERSCSDYCTAWLMALLLSAIFGLLCYRILWTYLR